MIDPNTFEFAQAIADRCNRASITQPEADVQTIVGDEIPGALQRITDSGGVIVRAVAMAGNVVVLHVIRPEARQ